MRNREAPTSELGSRRSIQLSSLPKAFQSTESSVLPPAHWPFVTSFSDSAPSAIAIPLKYRLDDGDCDAGISNRLYLFGWKFAVGDDVIDL